MHPELFRIPELFTIPQILGFGPLTIGPFTIYTYGEIGRAHV